MRLPLNRLSAAPTETLTTDGRIWCARRGDLDVEWCLDCARLESIEERDGEFAIRCRPGPRIVTEVEPFVTLR